MRAELGIGQPETKLHRLGQSIDDLAIEKAQRVDADQQAKRVSASSIASTGYPRLGCIALHQMATLTEEPPSTGRITPVTNFASSLIR